MKTKFIISSLILSLTLFSCKKENKDTENQSNESEKFQVTLELVIKKDDSLQLFYRDEAIPSYSEENSLWTNVKGSENAQEVKFELPEVIIPTHLRFDLGKNAKDQAPITIKNFKMEYKGKTYESKDSTMVHYFLANEQFQYEPIGKVLTPTKVEGQPYDPFIFSTDLLGKQVKLLLK